MKKISIPKPSQLALLLTAALAQAAWAGSGDAPAMPTRDVLLLKLAAWTGSGDAPAQQTPAQAEAASPSAETGAASGGNWFDSTTSASQQAFTPNYEQSVRGLSGSLTSTDKTASASGIPLRTSSGIFIYPSVKVGLGYNDNVLGTPTNPTSSSLVTLQPGVMGEIKTHGDRYTANYAGNYTKYSSNSNDNFNQHTLMLAGDNIFTGRTKLSWDAGYKMGSDPRGSTDRAISTEPDRWHSQMASAVFTYGAAGAAGRVELEGSVQNKRYDNNRATTESADVNLTSVAGRFFYRVAPKTSMLFELRDGKADYQLASSTQDNTERRYYVGATWEATAATTGIIKVGRMTKDFDNSGNPGFTGSSWEGAIRWKPLTYSVFNLVTSKSTSDSTGVGNYMVNQNVSVAWSHNWNSYLASRATAGVLKSDYAGVDRSDNIKNYGLGLTYDMRRWLRAGVEWAGTQRNSSVPSNDFTRNVTMLTLEGTL